MTAIDAAGPGHPDTGDRALRAATRLRDRARPERPDTVARAGLFLWTPVCLAFGIGGWFSLRDEPAPAFYLALAVVGLLAALVGLRAAAWAETGRLPGAVAGWARIAGFAVALTAAGAGLAGLRAHRADTQVLGYRYYGAIEGRVVGIDRSGRDRMRLTLDRVVLPGMATARTPGKVRLSLTDPALLPDQLPDPGQVVMTTGHLGPSPGPAEPGGFDFRLGAWFDGLGAVGYTRNPILTVEPVPEGAMAMQRLRQRAAAGIADGIGGQEGAVAAALMTGDRSRIAEATNELMRTSNLYHIVSISGLHMAMLAGFVYAALRLALVGAQGAGLLPAGVAWHKVAALAALLAATAYLWMSGGGVATERAFVMVAAMLGAILADRRAISLRTVALAGTLILAMNPHALLSPGFQMSFAATVALILTAGPWARVSPRLPWYVRPVAMLVISSLVAGLATSPIAAAHFSRAAQYGLAANLLVVPIVGALVMPAGAFAALLAPLGLAAPALWVMGIGTRWMLVVAAWIAGLDGAVYAVAAPPPATLPLLCGGTLIAALALRRKAGRIARGVGAAAILAVVAGVVLWLRVERPAILIAPEGAAVGILGPEGRALSKPANAFIADSWIEADGDTATAEEAAARPGWTGPRGERQATVTGEGVAGVMIVHLTGKAGRAAWPAACTSGAVVIADFDTDEVVKERSSGPRDADSPGKADGKPDRTGGDSDRPDPTAGKIPRQPCTVFDIRRLRRTGSVAGRFTADGLHWTTAADVSGDRRWARD